MTKLYYTLLLAGLCLASCTKNATNSPVSNNTLEYSFTATDSSTYQVTYYDPTSAAGVNTSFSGKTWSKKITLGNTTTAQPFFVEVVTSAQNLVNDNCVMAISVGGVQKATANGVLSNNDPLIQATFNYTQN